MADKNEIAFDLEVKGVEQSINSVKDLKDAIKAAKDEQIKMASAFGEGSKEYLDATKNLSGLKDRVDDLNDSTKSLKGSGVEQLTQGFAQMKEGIMNLDFEKVKVGIAAMKSGMGAFATSAKTALQGVKGALIATGIGALVVLLGTIVAYWDEIKGAISGVTEEQKRLNAVSKENLTVEQDKLKALEASDNSLKLQGKSEREILELKVKQLDAAYEKAEVDLQNSIQTQLFQEAAEKRNKQILQGLITMITAPMSLVLGAIDLAGKALGKNFGLGNTFRASVTDTLLGDEKENEEKRKKELDAQVQLLKDLKEKRAGYQLGINKIDEDAAKEAAEKAKKAAEDYKAYLDKRNEDYLKSQQDELAVLKKRLEDEALLLQQQRESQFSLDEAIRAAKYKKGLDEAELNALNNENDVEAQIALLEAKRQIELQNLELTNTERAIINKKYADQEDELREKQAEEEKALELAKQNEILNFAQMSTQSHQALSDAFFAVKNRNLQKGSAAERKSAEQQFKINKALAIQSAVISGIQGVINALSAQSVVPEPFGTVLKVATAVGVGIAAAANIAKIASTKFDAGGGGGGGGGSATLPSAPPIPSPPSISTQQNNTSQSTSFDETGKRIGGDSEKQMTPVIQVKATVGVDEVSSKTNRVETLEKQSTF
jgi:hypothetical protein